MVCVCVCARECVCFLWVMLCWLKQVCEILKPFLGSQESRHLRVVQISVSTYAEETGNNLSVQNHRAAVMTGLDRDVYLSPSGPPGDSPTWATQALAGSGIVRACVRACACTYVFCVCVCVCAYLCLHPCVCLCMCASVYLVIRVCVY